MEGIPGGEALFTLIDAPREDQCAREFTEAQSRAAV
jgi:hypothetical protein